MVDGRIPLFDGARATEHLRRVSSHVRVATPDGDWAQVATALTGIVVVHTVGRRVEVAMGGQSAVKKSRHAKRRASSLKPIAMVAHGQVAQNLSFLKKKSTLGCFSLSASGLL